jgi:2-iminobutanoate/2-iminopropanoate deaminase
MKSTLHSPGAPRAIGPYSPGQVVRLHGGQKLVFTAGQIGLDPASGQLVTGGIRAETERACESLRALLDAAGLTLDDVVKTTVFMADLQEFQAMNETYERYFGAALPARSTVQVAGLPRGARVEIEVVALGRDL